MADFRPDVVLLDMDFHTDINTGNEGLYWLSEIKKRTPETEVVLFTAYADIQLAVEGMKRGAFDFIVKPWDNDKLVENIETIIETIVKVKPQSSKGTYLRNVSITSTMGPGLKVDASSFM